MRGDRGARRPRGPRGHLRPVRCFTSDLLPAACASYGPGKKMTGGAGHGARPAYEAVAAKGDVTASDSWTGSCTAWVRRSSVRAKWLTRVAHGAPASPGERTRET